MLITASYCKGLWRLKLIHIAIVQWTHSYLTCRSQVIVVHVGSEQSPSLPVISGMLQGSVLGPLLFLILFINEVVNQISPGSTISHFVDDIALC